MRRIRPMIVLAALAGLAVACAAPPETAPPPSVAPVPDDSTKVLPPRETRVVYFAYGSAELSPEGKQEVAAAARSAAKGRKALYVIGHADTVGGNVYNKLLSGRRADAVIAELARHGIDKGISIVVEGKDRPAVVTPDGVEEPLNRRVDITIVR